MATKPLSSQRMGSKPVACKRRPPKQAALTLAALKLAAPKPAASMQSALILLVRNWRQENPMLRLGQQLPGAPC